MTTVEAPLHRRGKAFEPQGPDGYHIGWYAVAPSVDVTPGKVIGVDFLSGRVIAYRGQDGEVRVQGAYCRHLGADLSVGDVVGNDIRCAFHNWQYGPDGGCTNIPAGDRIPKSARLYSYPTAEAYGMIWAFNGENPTGLPRFRGHEPEALVGLVGAPIDFPVEPWILFTNGIDVQHLRVVHGLEVDCDLDAITTDDEKIGYDLVVTDPNLGTMQQNITIFGTSTVMMTGLLGGVEMLLAATATPLPGGGCRNYAFSASTPDANGGVDAEVEARLTMSLGFGEGLIKDDVPIMTSIHMREEFLLPADRALVRYLHYVRDYPRANPGGEFIR